MRAFVVSFLVPVGFFLAGLGAWPSCSCGPSTSASVLLDGATVMVDAQEGLLTVTRDDRVVWSMRPDDIGTSTGDARYRMEFGMFDIVEDFEEVVVADALAIADVKDDQVEVQWLRGEKVLATTSIRADRGILMTTTAPGASRVFTATRCEPSHHFLGLGAQSADVDHRGQIVPLWVSEQGIGKSDNNELPTLWQLLGRRHTTHAPMPAFVRSDAVAVVVETSAFARFDLCKTEEKTAAFEVWQDTQRVRLLHAKTPMAAQQRLSHVLGRPRLLPPYALAPWNDAIFSEEQVRAFAAFLRQERIPSSVIWSEDWRGGQQSGALYRLDEDWRLDRAQYPTYEDMAAALREQGFAHQVYFNTFVNENGDVYDEVIDAGHALVKASSGELVLFAGPDREFSPTTLLDLSNGAAREWMKRDHLREALRLGARGWMADYAEWMPVDDVRLASGESPALFHNRYPVEWARINREAVTEAGLLDEVIVFARAGHLGSPEVVDVFWAGDQRTSFDVDDGLPTVLPIGIGTSTTGFGWFAHDIAGYQSSTNDPTSKELFFRWTELGAFTPVMRTHHGTHAALNHNLQSDVETTAHWKRYAELHVRLYPYLRALAVAMTSAVETVDDVVDAATEVGAGMGPLPLWVPMPLRFPQDEPSWSIKDQVLLGPSLLIAPVLAEGRTSRLVHFPPGRFVPFVLPGFTPAGVAASAAVTGPADVDVEAPLSEIPVFLPAGGIVPLTAEPAQTLLEVDDPSLLDLRSTNGDRVVLVALGAPGRFLEEDGAGYVLDGDGTSLPQDADVDGAVVIVGNGSTSAAGMRFSTVGHPATRRIRVLFR
jgi:alpha-glucosidase